MNRLIEVNVHAINKIGKITAKEIVFICNEINVSLKKIINNANCESLTIKCSSGIVIMEDIVDTKKNTLN